MLIGVDHYTLAIWSKSSSITPDTAKSLFILPRLESLLFPCELPVAPKKAVLFSSGREFDLSLIPKAFRRKGVFLIPLDGINGVQVEIVLDTTGKGRHSFDLHIPFDKAKAGLVSGTILKEIFFEVLPPFRCEEEGHVFYYGPNEQEIVYYGYERMKWIRISLGWLSYYGPKALEVLGRERFDNLKTCQEKVELEGGILIVLQEEPLDLSNPEHLARKQQAERELGFDELAKDESRVKRRQPIRVPPST
ncbi:MAG: hypothetical protein ACK8QZ_05665 [Anaerolineales bacterium]